MNRPTLAAALTVWALLAACPPARAQQYPAPKSLGPVETYGRHIQRTMGLLASSTPEKRNDVRVLFYGQSITEQDWWKNVADDLRRRFPHANLTIENRAIGGFASQLLVRTAETDLYPFCPDLVIFHVYGSHIEYENIIRRIRERTTAEILLQSDHATKDDDLTEETDPAKLSPKNWSPWINHAFLPGTAKKYGAEFVNQHELWKQYLRDHNLKPAALLKDGVHLNDHGCYLMAEIAKAYLRHDPKASPEMAKQVQTLVVGKDVQWQDGKLRLPIEGNRVDVVLKPTGAPADVKIDGRAPAEIPELYALTRTTYYPGSKWPCLMLVGSAKPRVAEEWTLTLSDVAPDLKQFKFRLVGSVTGEDGEGTATEKFVSRSGRVVIDPADWNFDYAQKVFPGKKVTDGFKIQWKVLPQFVERITPAPPKTPGVEPVVTVAQGLIKGPHTLELTGGVESPISAIRIYRPPLW